MKKVIEEYNLDTKVLFIVSSINEQKYTSFLSNGIPFNIAMFILGIIYAFIIYYIIKLEKNY